MKASLLTLPVLALIVLSGPVAMGAESHFGGQITAARPGSDLGGSTWMDGKIAPGLGLHILVDMEDGNALVPRLDYTMHKRDTTVSGVSVDRKADIWNLGVDYNYYFSAKASEGFYLSAGLGWSSARFDVSASAGPGSQTKSALSFGLGGGFMFNPHVGLEVRYTSARFNDVTYDLGGKQSMDVNAPALTASLMLRY